jgi:outer membrane protein OmpA-like peptidoglycan-associated protein
MLVTSAPPATAEPVGSYLYFVPFGGYTAFPEHVRFSKLGSVSDEFYVGGRLGYQTTRWLGVEIAGGFSPTSETFQDTTTVPPVEKDLNFLHGSADLVVTPFSGHYGGPFLLLGGGGLQLSRTVTKSRFRQVTGEAGAGVQLWMGDAVGVRLEGRYLVWQSKSPLATTKDWVGTAIVGGGVSLAIGATPRDADGDGVPDRKDQCPGTPHLARVDEKGCPIDSDGDGVFDGLDECPSTARGATVDAKGCPTDSDGDGVADGIDQCADTPKGAKIDDRGCPSDADGDGVFDGIDQCPDTPKGALADEKGCPKDSDNDGVFDGIDKCADTSPGLRVDKDGCPIEVTERETELLDTGMIRLQNVNFTTGKADLLPESLPQLDIVGQVLTKWPDLKIEIGGHTDSRGSNAYNQRLSEARTNSVLNYLLQKFPSLKREQYTVMGYGESQPLVPNTSALNWAKNRRVEFKVLNREVLKREIEHRKLLKNN